METNELIKEIGKTILLSIPENVEWIEVEYSMNIIITYSEDTTNLLTSDGVKSLSVKFRDPDGNPIHPNLPWQLRENMYQVDKGTWFFMRMSIKSDGKFNLSFDYDNKPNFLIPLSDQDYIRDYQKFPRKADIVPEWLFQILKRNNVGVISEE